MNSTLDIIKKRRSVRSFKREEIADSEIAAIVEAGTYAPSGRGDQSWHFTVVQNTGLLNIGSCWISGLDLLATGEGGSPAIKKLNIPGYKPYFSVALGFKKNENPEAAPRKEKI